MLGRGCAMVRRTAPGSSACADPRAVSIRETAQLAPTLALACVAPTMPARRVHNRRRSLPHRHMTVERRQVAAGEPTMDGLTSPSSEANRVTA